MHLKWDGVELRFSRVLSKIIYINRFLHGAKLLFNILRQSFFNLMHLFSVKLILANLVPREATISLFLQTFHCALLYHSVLANDCVMFIENVVFLPPNFLLFHQVFPLILILTAEVLSHHLQSKLIIVTDTGIKLVEVCFFIWRTK